MDTAGVRDTPKGRALGPVTFYVYDGGRYVFIAGEHKWVGHSRQELHDHLDALLDELEKGKD